MDVYIGFDSAWTDNAKAPGAICAVGVEAGRPVLFHPPRLVTFDQALTFIREVGTTDGVTLVALDQPTLVPNAEGMRSVERVAASLVSWLGGGVQPANRSRLGMFCDAAPVWRFLKTLGATEDPEAARTAATGLHVMEVFPALALASLDPGFFGRLGAPRYNPQRRKTFRPKDWVRVTGVAAATARTFGCLPLADWCAEAGVVARPAKADQDRLDAALCALVALRWRLSPREKSLLLGNLIDGYIIAPASTDVRRYLTQAACRHEVAMDGVIPRRSTAGSK